MIVVVPARGGSKGLARKNIRPLLGQPLIVHTLHTALAAPSVERVIVTTDDVEIMDVCRGIEGVEVPFRRPVELASDTAGAVDVYLHAADWLGKHEGVTPAAICVLLPTSPLRMSADIDGAIAMFKNRNADAVVSVSEAEPVDWLQTLDADGKMTPFLGEAASIANRQALNENHIFNGSIYVLDVEVLRRTRSYHGAKTYGYVMPKDRSIDIDDETNFICAEAVMRHQQTPEA